MRKIILYIAMSLDGKIADENGNVNWLVGDDIHDTSSTYDNFIQNIDTVIMGYNTYHQVVTELSPDTWVYKGLKTFVFTHKSLTSSYGIEFINESIVDKIQQLKQENGKDIWICGGASIIQPLIENHLIDIYRISIIPTILGKGISLFSSYSQNLKLIESKTINGIIELIYEKK
ncbi:MAG: dihydrofolate reductase family protein [Erysipelotrichales bacterium]|nr:dihydrofolate reductase family protein [Erysipelotrichales bacterium]